MQFSPTTSQAAGTAALLRRRALSLWVPMGRGKTAMVLSAFCELLSTASTKGALVVAPLRVIYEVWPREVEKWDAFRHLRYTILHGPHKIVQPGYDLYLVNYEGLPWLAEYLNALALRVIVNRKASNELFALSKSSKRRGVRAAVQRLLRAEPTAYDIFFIVDTARKEDRLTEVIFNLELQLRAMVPVDMIVWDEITRMKHPSTRRFRAWRELMPFFLRRWGMTGSPAANGYADLFGQFFMLDNGRRLGTTITSFRRRWMRPIPHVDYNAWELLPGAEIEIHQLVQDAIYEVDPQALAGKPPLVNDIWVDLPDKARAVYQEIWRDFSTELKTGRVEALTASGRGLKLLQVAQGAVYDETGDWHHVHDVKLQALDEILEEAAGNPVLVVYAYRHDLARLRERYRYLEVLDSRSTSRSVVDRWNRGQLPLLAIHPALGHGLNLQYGGHNLAWFGLPPSRNLEHYEQTNARLHGRHGQRAQVTIHRILARDTMDQVVVHALNRKRMTQEELITAIFEAHKSK